MEFTINAKTLKTEVGLMQSIAEKKSGIAVLSSLLIESIGKDQLKLVATDLDTTVSTVVKADIKKEGSICMSAKRLSDIVRSLDDADIKFKKDPNDWVRVTCNTSKFRIQGISKEQFPAIPDVEADEVIMDGDVFKELIRHTCFAVTQEETRFALSGAKLEIDGGKVRMIATDGHRIALMEDDIDDIEAQLDVLVPKRALAEVSKFVGNEVVITNSHNHIKFESGDRVLISRKLAMNFPNYQGALPKNNDIEVIFDVNDMVKALKRTAITADELSKAVNIEFSEDKMLLTSASDGESEETVQCTVENLPEKGLTINLNWLYLTEYLSICHNPSFKIKDGGSAIEVVDGTSRYVVMPLRAN